MLQVRVVSRATVAGPMAAAEVATGSGLRMLRGYRYRQCESYCVSAWAPCRAS